MYYAQLRIDLGNGKTAPRRLALEATTLDDQARAALERAAAFAGQCSSPVSVKCRLDDRERLH
jgi:hypothetical protein